MTKQSLRKDGISTLIPEEPKFLTFYRLLLERPDELRLDERDGREKLPDLLLELGLEKLPGFFVGFVVVLEGVNVFGLWDGFRVDGF